MSVGSRYIHTGGPGIEIIIITVVTMELLAD